MKKSVMATLVVILMLVVPFTGCSISGEDATDYVDEPIVEQAAQNDEGEQAEDTRGEDVADYSNMFYDDGNGMVWMFRSTGESDATIAGGYINGSVTEMKVPKSVSDNRYLNAEVSISIETADKGDEYAVIELRIKGYNAEEYSIRYLNIHFSEGDSKNFKFEELSSDPGVGWINLASGKKVIIQGIQSVSVVDTIIKKNQKDVENVVSPKCNISIENISFEDKECSGEYTVRSIGSNAFHCSNDSQIVTSIGVTNDLKYRFLSDTIFKITIPNTVESIGDYAFYGFSKLKNLSFEPDSNLKTIGIESFMNCGSKKLYEGSRDIADTVEINANNVNSISKVVCRDSLTITVNSEKELDEGQRPSLYHCNKTMFHKDAKQFPKEGMIFSSTEITDENSYKYIFEFNLKDGGWVVDDQIVECTKKRGQNHFYYIYTLGSIR